VTIAADDRLEFELSLSLECQLSLKVRKAGTQTWQLLTDSTTSGHELGEDWRGEPCYFKLGSYIQDPGPDATPAAIIHFHELKVE
jgi:hypothetical protein